VKDSGSEDTAVVDHPETEVVAENENIHPDALSPEDATIEDVVAEEGEQPVETPVVATEPTKEPIVETPAEPVLTMEKVSTFLNDQFKQEIDINAIPDKLKELQTLQDTYGNLPELDKQFLAYRKQGGSIENFLKIQLVDFTKLSDVEAIKHKMSLDNPELSQGHIDAELRGLYGEALSGEEHNGDEEILRQEVKLMRDAKTARAFLQTLKVEDSKPTPVVDTKAKEVIDNFRIAADKAIGAFKEIELQVGDAKVTYAADATKLAAMADFVRNPDKVLGAFKSLPEMIEALYYVRDKEAIIAHIVNQATSRAKETMEKDIDKIVPFESNGVKAATANAFDKALEAGAKKAWGIPN